PTEAGVELLNGTQTAGLARRAADTLRSGGFQTVRYDDAPRPQAASTIEVRSGAHRSGLKVASLLRLPPDSVRESVNLSEDLDVRAPLGAQYSGPYPPFPTPLRRPPAADRLPQSACRGRGRPGSRRPIRSPRTRRLSRP